MRRQLLAVFLIALIAGSSATETQFKLNQKQSIISDIKDKNSQFYELLEEGSQYIVDQVLTLLKNLEDAARKDLSNLNAAWVKEEALLQRIQANAKKAWLKQQTECNRLEAQQHVLEHKILVREDEMAANKKVIAENTHKVKVQEKERCKSNNLYIDHIIDHRDAILLFAVLRKAIEGYQPGSFVQLTQFKQDVATLGDLINVYAQQHASEFQGIMSQLKQQDRKVDSKFHSKKSIAKVHNYSSRKQYKQVGRVQRRKNIGNGYIDNKKQQIKLDKLSQNTVRKLSMIKGELIRVLDKIEKVEKTKQKTQQVEESKANEAAATYKSRLQDEQRKLTRRNEVLTVEIAELKVKLAAKIAEVKKCRSQEALLLSAYKKAQKNLIDARARYVARKSVLEQEIILFARLWKYYQARVYNVATKADRQRIQDHVDHKNFKRSSSYTAKSASKYNHYRHHVPQKIHAEAEAMQF